MINKFAFCLLALLAMWALSACDLAMIEGSGVSASETRDVGDFDIVSLEGSGRLEITQGEKTALVIEADDNLLDMIETRVESGRLRIRLKHDFGTSIRTKTKMVFHLTVKDLKEINLAGSGDIVSERLDVENLSIDIAGSGEVELGGSAGRLNLAIAGSGDCALADFKVKEADISIAGSGSAILSVEKKLDVSVAGSGDITYYGSPEVSQSISGSGSVRKAADEPTA